MIKLKRFLILVIVANLSFFAASCATGEDPPAPALDEINGTLLAARTGERYFEVFDGTQWTDLTVKGVNVGTSLPGRWYTEFPADIQLYRSWLNDIAAMNANTVRIYTLLDPSFYRALSEHNSDPDNETLWLIQEIWPHDEVPELNLYDQDYRDNYLEEIERVIDALHGSADIPSRPYRAYGNYSADVSPYVLGILIGRELEPDEVAATDKANPELDGYSGKFVRAAAGQASPTEVWLAEMSDHTLQYSQSIYSHQYPVGFVSWPTLDPLTHFTEWEEDGTPGYNDREEVNPNVFSAGPENEAGFFGAYHIYPNYPDFMNNEPAFAEHEDDQGVFRYKGYLNQFMAIHPPYPALVAEFGISTSLNTSHINPEGLNHGGLTEQDQGEMTVRMMRSILDEGYAGGIIFEWTDEWAKKTWNTEPFMIPWERQVFWQNAMCPEQNYGLVAVEPEVRSEEELYQTWLEASATEAFNPPDNRPESFGKIKAIEVGADEAFLYLTLTIDPGNSSGSSGIPWDELGIAVGIDVGIRDAGSFAMPLHGLPDLPTGTEFLLHVSSPEQAELLVVPSYNRASFNFKPEPAPEANYERIEALVNRERITPDGRVFPALYSDESELKYGNFIPSHPDYDSTSHFFTEGDSGRIIFRLPWMLLNVSDPSAGSIIIDAGDYSELPARDELAYGNTKGLFLYSATYSKAALNGEQAVDIMSAKPEAIDFEPRRGNSFNEETEPYLWNGWEEPRYRFRLKESFEHIAGYFETIDN